MPIQEKNLGKYVRPDIYIEEFDNSTIDTPVTQNVLINLIPGFSKKGPYNYPVYIDTKQKFENTFGTIDYQLERKGSYFHRTCLKMLETGPIWALNILSTVPGRDKLNYVSISTTAKYDSSNLSVPYVADYETFFNRQDFWEKDTETFLDLVKEDNNDTTRLLHLTNMGEKTITVFLFKSTATNFDVTAEAWYDGITKVPSYIHPKSLISDYLVDVLIVEGNWTDYDKLSVDTKWSKYFTSEGLIIANLSNFMNETGVSVLANYDTSLIPNFKDLNGRVLFIEDVINNDTNKTSLFCAYNKDLLLDSDYLSDLVDLVGFTIVGNSDVNEINFLSYKQPIKETISYSNVSLDSSNNVFALNTSGQATEYGTTWLNWSTDGISLNSGSTINNDNLSIDFDLSTPTYIINGVKYSTLSGTTKTVYLSPITDGYQRTDIIYLDTNGIQVQNGIDVLSGATESLREINFENLNTIILGTVNTIRTGSNYVKTYTAVTVDVDGFLPLDITVSSGSTNDETYINYEFNNTIGSKLYNFEYLRLRSIKHYNELITNLYTGKSVIVKNSASNKSIIGYNYKSSTFSTINNAYVKIYITDPNDYLTGAIYYIDKEFNWTSGTEIKTSYNLVNNVVAKYSDFYQDFINGNINNGDYIITNGVKNYLTMYENASGLTITFDIEPDQSPLDVITDLGNWKQTLEIESVGEITDETNTYFIKVDKTRYSEIKKGYYIESYYDETYYNGDGVTLGDNVPMKLTRIINVKNDSVNTSLKILYTDGPIKINTIENTTEKYTTVYPPIHSYATMLKGAALTPFKINIDSIPNGTEGRLNTILNVIGKGTQMFKGLINKNKISWRYLVDSFGLGLTERSKQQYLDLCGAKLNCFGFINMPSVRDFKKSINPSFTDEYGAFSTEHLKNGADLDKNPDFLYTFGDGNGRSTTGYFLPYVKHTVDGVTKEVPPAAFVASSYMRKQLSNSAGTFPWTIVAGVSDGRVTGIGGTEMDFTPDDLTNLAEMGVNPITFIRNVGYIINDESTAQVYPVSSLSYIHSREVLIELENQLYDMLLRYQWKFNTAAIRSEIKYKADSICRSFVDAGGLYAFRNIIDLSNNTSYIIDLQGGVLDTHVEIVKGMGWIVNNITIEKTGTLNSTGFTA